MELSKVQIGYILETSRSFQRRENVNRYCFKQERETRRAAAADARHGAVASCAAARRANRSERIVAAAQRRALQQDSTGLESAERDLHRLQSDRSRNSAASATAFARRSERDERAASVSLRRAELRAGPRHHALSVGDCAGGGELRTQSAADDRSTHHSLRRVTSLPRPLRATRRAPQEQHAPDGLEFALSAQRVHGPHR